MDGRSGQGRPGADPPGGCTGRPELDLPFRQYRVRGQLPAGQRQPVGLLPPVLPASGKLRRRCRLGPCAAQGDSPGTRRAGRALAAEPADSQSHQGRGRLRGARPVELLRLHGSRRHGDALLASPREPWSASMARHPAGSSRSPTTSPARRSPRVPTTPRATSSPGHRTVAPAPAAARNWPTA